MLGSALLLLGLTAAVIPSAQAQGKVVQRNLQEWLDAQGTFFPGALFGFYNNPDVNGDGVDDGPRYIVFWDYAGLLSRPGSPGYVDSGNNLGPSITGKVTERPIGGGMAEVTVSLNINDALITVDKFDGGVVGPIVFGHSETDVAAGSAPALANARLIFKFTNPVGGPLLDLIQTYFDFELYSFTMVLGAEGPLTAAFDPAVQEGTPGALHWGKPGLLSSPANAHADNGAASLFPHDTFRLAPIGNK